MIKTVADADFSILSELLEKQDALIAATIEEEWSRIKDDIFNNIALAIKRGNLSLIYHGADHVSEVVLQGLLEKLRAVLSKRIKVVEGIFAKGMIITINPTDSSKDGISRT